MDPLARNACVYPMPMPIVGAEVDGKPDIKKINPFTLTMPDNCYGRVGEMAGRAWSDGKKLKA